ncbi:hypothetical protein KC19_3G085900 [Ceratodon purpureus]|uniref:Protein SMG7 n=1 Tax=Ceratodon purpureus TaxID=3225 RepID=A0A8T0IGD0_CERPU|nr:hypothetical protein KC19_3G085900 [Ceratodon purpureus]
MMSLLSDAAPVSAPLALAKHHYNQAQELEKQLRSLLQVKGPFDSSVRSLQTSLREKYELVILEDHELAESHEVEQAIWRLHYKQIDEFRAKIKKINHAASTNKGGTQRDSVLKILAAFKSFLAEVTGFYHNLILKLRAKNGLPQDYSTFESSDSVSSAGDDNERKLRVKRCQLSCHRCLIFLGDLARYKEVHGNAHDTRSIDFSVAAGYYLQAASLWPPSGNPHNQLAVLATYVSDELLAVYRYFRSLAVETPFLTARDNLILLFEKNRLQYSQLHGSKGAVPGGGPQVSPTGMAGRGDRIVPHGSGTLKLAKKDVKSENTDASANLPKSADLRRNFQIRFVRMNGILFTRTSLETFSQVYLETLSDLEQLLAGSDSILEAALGTDYQSRTSMGNAGPSCVIQLVAILIFTVHNINWSADSTNHPTYAEILQRSDLFQHALTAAFECAGRLMHRCSQSKDPSRSVLLPALLMFMEWLAGRPEMAIGSEVDVDQANARSSFWAECLVLLNCFLKMFKEEPYAANGFDGSFGGAIENERGVALGEDFELQGFIPLAPAQTALDYSKGYFREGKGEKQFKVRIKRLLAAGKAVANALESSQRGICYDEDLDRFVLAGEARQAQKEEENADAGIEDIADILEEEDNDGGITSQSSLLASDSHLKAENLAKSPEKILNEEEDEEVIVFKPLTKDKPPASEPVESSYSDNFVPAFNFSTVPTSEVSVQTTSMPSVTGKNPWLPEASLNVQSGSVATKFQSPFQLTPGPGQYSSVESNYPLDPNIAVTSSKSGLVELATPMPLISVTGSSTGSTPMVHDAAAAISNLHLSGMNSLGNEASVARSRDFPVMTSTVTSSGNWLDQYSDTPQYVSSSADAWFQGQKGVFKNFPEKRMGTGSIVTSQSQNNSLWSSEREPLDRSGVSGFVPSGTPNDRLNGEMLMNSSSLSLLSSPEVSSGFESGKYSVGSNRDVPTSSSWNMKDLPVPTRVSHPAMRPPPGFGPLPGKSTVKPILNTSQGIFQPPSAFQSQRPSVGEDNVDDYGWLDDFRSVKPVSPQSGYSAERESQLSNSSRNLWSAGFDSAPFPFPGIFNVFEGMGASHHRKFNTTVGPHIQGQSPYPESQLAYTERQKPVDEAQAQVKAQAELRQLQQQQQQLMFFQRQQQQYQQQMPGQYHSRDPFVS